MVEKCEWWLRKMRRRKGATPHCFCKSVQATERTGVRGYFCGSVCAKSAQVIGNKGDGKCLVLAKRGAAESMQAAMGPFPNFGRGKEKWGRSVRMESDLHSLE